MPEWNAIYKRTTDGADDHVDKRIVTADTEPQALEEAGKIGDAEGIDYNAIEVHEIDPDSGFVLDSDGLDGSKRL